MITLRFLDKRLVLFRGQSESFNYTTDDGTCPRAEGVRTLALVQAATTERRRNNLTIYINTKRVQEPSAYTEDEIHPLPAVPLGIINEKRPVLLMVMNALESASEPHEVQTLTESARAAT